MKIESVHLKNFRNFSDLSVLFPKRVNVLHGENGQGKTNLLESLYLLTKSTSFRPSDNRSLITKSSSVMQLEACEPDTAFIKGEFLSKGLYYDLNLQVLCKTRKLKLNGKPIAFRQMAMSFPTLLFSPESLSIIKSGPEGRRELIDDHLIMLNNNNKKLIFDYRKVLKNKNRVLRNHKLGGADYNETLALIQSINAMLVPLSKELTRRRILAVKSLQPQWIRSLKGLFGDNYVDSCIEYMISSQSVIDWSEDKVYDLIDNRMNELASAEINSGTSLSGPQKHDISFRFKGEEARLFCSQGQQRIFVLALKIAQAVQLFDLHGEYPVLFLDDVFSELDGEKKNNLMRFLNNLGAQIFLTTTDISNSDEFDNDELSSFFIEQGKIREY